MLRTAGEPGAEPGKSTAYLEKLNGKDMPTGAAAPTVAIPVGGDVSVAFP
jgi:hypothetical protein